MTAASTTSPKAPGDTVAVIGHVASLTLALDRLWHAPRPDLGNAPTARRTHPDRTDGDHWYCPAWAHPQDLTIVPVLSASGERSRPGDQQPVGRGLAPVEPDSTRADSGRRPPDRSASIRMARRAAVRRRLRESKWRGDWRSAGIHNPARKPPPPDAPTPGQKAEGVDTCARHRTARLQSRMYCGDGKPATSTVLQTGRVLLHSLPINWPASGYGADHSVHQGSLTKRDGSVSV